MQPIRPHSAAIVSRPGCAPAALSETSPAVTGLASAPGLEELDRVAGGVVEHDLPAAGAADDLVPERDSFTGQAFDLGLDVVDDQVDPVPAAGPRLASVRHRPSCRA